MQHLVAHGFEKVQPCPLLVYLVALEGESPAGHLRLKSVQDRATYLVHFNHVASKPKRSMTLW